MSEGRRSSGEDSCLLAAPGGSGVAPKDVPAAEACICAPLRVRSDGMSTSGETGGARPDGGVRGVSDDRPEKGEADGFSLSIF